MTTLPRSLTYQGIPIWRHERIIRWVAQTVSGVVVVVLVAWFFFNINSAIQERNIPYGYDFLSRAYQVGIGHHFVPFESSDTYFKALVVAATNTLIVAASGIVLAIMLGIFIGVARLSGNWIVSRVATVYIEFFRNVPLLVQLIFWFYILLALPPVLEGYVFAGNIYVNNAGISVPWIAATGPQTALVWLLVAALGITGGIVVHRWQSRREALTGAASYPVVYGFAVPLVAGAAAWLVVGLVSGEAPFVSTFPAPEGSFGRIEGGFTAPAGLLGLLVGLVIYTSSFIAEIVRAGIQSVNRGQREAASALGLSPMKALRHVTFPQALRVIIPPLISQCLNLTKNSSLAGAIAYPDLTNVAKTMTTQQAPAVSIFILIMLAYLAMSLTWSLIGNLYNRHIRFREG